MINIEQQEHERHRNCFIRHSNANIPKAQNFVGNCSDFEALGLDVIGINVKL